MTESKYILYVQVVERQRERETSSQSDPPVIEYGDKGRFPEVVLVVI